jgi:hypothetical protein
MPNLPGFDDVMKAVLTAVATTLVSRISGVFEVLTDPNSPRRKLDDAKQGVAIIDAASKVMVQLSQLPSGADRDRMLAEINELLQSMQRSQQSSAAELLEKRARVLRTLSLMRLNMPRNSAKAILSFLFYISLALTIQSIRLYIRGVPLNGHLVWILSVISALLWVLSASKVENTEVPVTPPEQPKAAKSGTLG